VMFLSKASPYKMMVPMWNFNSFSGSNMDKFFFKNGIDAQHPRAQYVFVSTDPADLPASPAGWAGG
jgi:hypothetical protein